MSWFNHLQRTALSIALCAVFSAAHAKSFDQTGPAPATLPPLTTYGVDVATKTGLKSVVPAGWQLFVHRGVTLPASMSWKTGITWPAALEEFVEGTDVSVLVDWEKKSVYFRPVAVAVEDAANRAMVAQAATTPLPALKAGGPAPAVTIPDYAKSATPPSPAFDVATVNALESKVRALEGQLATAQEKKVAADTELAARLTSLETALKEKGDNLTVAQADLAAARDSARQAEKAATELRTQQEAARADMERRLQALAKPAPVAATPMPLPALTLASAAPSSRDSQPMVLPAVGSQEQYVALGSSKSFNQASVREVAQYAADVHGYALVMVGGEPSFKGPVTILGGDPGEDMRLMHKALGNAAGVSFELYREERILKVEVRTDGLKSYARVAEGPYSGPAPLRDPIRMTPRGTAPVFVPAPVAVAPSVVVPVQLPPVQNPPVVRAPKPELVIPLPVVSAPVAKVEVPPAEVAAPVLPKESVEAKQLRLQIAVGEDLQASLNAFLQAQGFELRWQVDEVFEASNVFDGSGNTVVEVLSLLLPKLGLSADVQSDAKRVTVRPADPVRDTK